MKKLHLGSGTDYRKGWVNLDNNPDLKSDCNVDLETESIPYPDNYFDYVYSHHTLEHIRNFPFIIDELWRVCKKGAIIEIIVPHFTSIVRKYPYHVTPFGIDTFKYYEINDMFTKERYGNRRTRLNVLKEKLSIAFSEHKNKKLAWTCYLNILNPLFNFSHFWQILMERYFYGGFDEIYYKLEVVK